MVKQELTKDALAKLEKLRRQFADFQEDCSKLLKSIENDDFLDSETAVGVQNTLANITTIQNQLGTIYQNLSVLCRRNLLKLLIILVVYSKNYL
ncbi:hypothetical protein [Phascolarctobacterium succinatutens]|uniref:hypothetical protein n=1 Tax=Phascolarctobacterium succinatutens TaxID=626940 RepID=UPI003AAC9B11